MGKLVYIMGKSGTGKSRSMKNIPAAQFALVNPEGKDLPFGKDAPAFKVESVVIDKADDIVKAMQRLGKKYKIVVVDDFQTVMTNEFMRRSTEMGYQKWTDIGKHAWEIANTAKELPSDCIVYILCHTEQDENGNEKIKTLGKLLDQNVVLESKSTIVLKTGVEDGKYFFCTQNNGRDTVKSPEGMFPTYAIQNDLKYVDDKIRNYYGLDGALSDEEVAAADAAASVGDVEKPAASGKRKRKSREEVQADNQQKIEEHQRAVEAAVDKVAGDREEVPFDEVEAAIDSVPAPELEKVPRRTRKTRSVEPSGMAEGAMNPPEEPEVLKEDTCFYIASDDNYVKKHAGDVAPEGGKVISEEEFKAGVVRIAQEGNVKSDPEPSEDGAAPTRRRRRTRS